MRQEPLGRYRYKINREAVRRQKVGQKGVRHSALIYIGLIMHLVELYRKMIGFLLI